MTERICNKCGKKMDPWDCMSGFHAQMDLGYGSQFDGCSIQLDLCNNCLDEFVKSCAINPITDWGA